MRASILFCARALIQCSVRRLKTSQGGLRDVSRRTQRRLETSQRRLNAKCMHETSLRRLRDVSMPNVCMKRLETFHATFFWVQNVFEFFYNGFGCKIFSNFFYNEFGCKIFSNFFYNEFGCKKFLNFFYNEFGCTYFIFGLFHNFCFSSLLPTHKKIPKVLYISKFSDMFSATTESNLLEMHMHSRRSLMTTLFLTSCYVLHSRHCYTATRFKSFGSRITLHILTLFMSHLGCPTLTGLTRCLCDVNPIYFLSVTIPVTNLLVIDLV